MKDQHIITFFLSSGMAILVTAAIGCCNQSIRDDQQQLQSDEGMAWLTKYKKFLHMAENINNHQLAHLGEFIAVLGDPDDVDYNPSNTVYSWNGVDGRVVKIWTNNENDIVNGTYVVLPYGGVD